MTKFMNATQAARFLNVKVKTLQKWDREGKLKPFCRTKSNRRVYSEAQLLDFLGLKSVDVVVVDINTVLTQIKNHALMLRLAILQRAEIMDKSTLDFMVEGLAHIENMSVSFLEGAQRV